MKCIVCNTGKLEIINSRKHIREPQVWRRRKCSYCSVVFTTKELPDYDYAFRIKTGKKKSSEYNFEKTILLAQLLAAGGHVKKQGDLVWLAETIAGKAFVKAAANDFIISNVEYRLLTVDTLKAYDTLLSANFEARGSLQ